MFIRVYRKPKPDVSTDTPYYFNIKDIENFQIFYSEDEIELPLRPRYYRCCQIAIKFYDREGLDCYNILPDDLAKLEEKFCAVGMDTINPDLRISKDK